MLILYIDIITILKEFIIASFNIFLILFIFFLQILPLIILNFEEDFSPLKTSYSYSTKLKKNLLHNFSLLLISRFLHNRDQYNGEVNKKYKKNNDKNNNTNNSSRYKTLYHIL